MLCVRSHSQSTLLRIPYQNKTGDIQDLQAPALLRTDGNKKGMTFSTSRSFCEYVSNDSSQRFSTEKRNVHPLVILFESYAASWPDSCFQLQEQGRRRSAARGGALGAWRGGAPPIQRARSRPARPFGRRERLRTVHIAPRSQGESAGR